MSTPKRLLVEGGGDMPYEGALAFFDWVGKTNAKILVITWASERTEEDLLLDFLSWGNNIFSMSQLLVSPQLAAMSSEVLGSDAVQTFLTQLAQCTGVFFCGGDQVYITTLLGKLPDVKATLTARYHEGLPFAGTSAGAAIMSHTMITGEGDFEVIDPNKVETADGLGLVRIAVIDQHFIKRKRLNRLLSVLLGKPEIYGIGVDEDMSVAIIDDVYCEVLGRPGSNIVFIEKPATVSADSESTLADPGFIVRVLPSGTKFKLSRSHL